MSGQKYLPSTQKYFSFAKLDILGSDSSALNWFDLKSSANDVKCCRANYGVIGWPVDNRFIGPAPFLDVI